MKPVRHYLEVFHPHTVLDVLVIFEAEAAIAAVAVGDLLDTRGFPGGPHPFPWLKVVGVNHIVWEVAGYIGHKTSVFTESAGGDLQALVFG